MTDAEWSNENPAPSKKLVPTWLWFCGGGCLLAVILVVLVGMWGFGKMQEFTDPDLQYEALSHVITFDERPEDWVFMGRAPLPFDIWTFTDKRGYLVLVMQLEGAEADGAREQVFDPESDGSFFNMGGRKEMELSSPLIQGREVQMITYYQGGGSGTSGENSGQAACVELSAPESEDLLLMILTRTNSGGRITVEELTEVLAPFHVGPDR